MTRQAGLPRISARSGRSAPDAHSLRGKPAEPLPPNSPEKPVSNPKSVKFSDPISVHFSNPIDSRPEAGAPLPPPTGPVRRRRCLRVRRHVVTPLTPAAPPAWNAGFSRHRDPQGRQSA